MARSPVSIQHQEIAETVAGQRRSVIQRCVTHRTNARQQCSGAVKCGGPDGKTGADQNGPAGLGLNDSLRQLFADGIRGKEIGPDGKMRAVFFKRADGEENHHTVAVKRLEFSEGQLFQAENTSAPWCGVWSAGGR